MNKAEVRKKLILWREAHKNKSAKDRAVFKNLNTLDEFKAAKSVLFYYSVNGEVDTIEPINNNLKSKLIYLPRLINETQFEAIAIKNLEGLKINNKNIPEPIGKSSLDEKIDLVIVPGVAFDKRGHRIGMGKGYYDRYLKNKTAKKIALAYEEQVLDSIPKDPYDVDVDIIVTDQNIYRCCPAL